VIDGLLLDEADRGTVLPIAQDFTDTIMRDLNDRIRVARAALALAERIR
jgi:LPPG:FO 2-phospho-L-lactate transferase